MSFDIITMPGSRFVVGPDKDSNDPERPPETLSSCQDLNGMTILSQSRFVPGPDACTVCVCDDGAPKWCQAGLCAPPQYCRSFRVGNSCCDFICLDDYLEGSDDGGGDRLGADLGLRLVASAVTAVLSLGLLLFLVHRLRGKRRQAGRRNNWRARESLASMGYLSGSAAYLSGQDRVEFMEEPPPHFVFWKPPSAYVPPPGEAPPPYSEVVAENETSAFVATARPAEESVIQTAQTGEESVGAPPRLGLAYSAASPSRPPYVPVELQYRPFLKDGQNKSLSLSNILGLKKKDVKSPGAASRAGGLSPNMASCSTPPPNYFDVVEGASSWSTLPSTSGLQPAEQRNVASLPRENRSNSRAPCYSENSRTTAPQQRLSLQLQLGWSPPGGLSQNPANPEAATSSASQSPSRVVLDGPSRSTDV